MLQLKPIVPRKDRVCEDCQVVLPAKQQCFNLHYLNGYNPLNLYYCNECAKKREVIK